MTQLFSVNLSFAQSISVFLHSRLGLFSQYLLSSQTDKCIVCCSKIKCQCQRVTHGNSLGIIIDETNPFPIDVDWPFFLFVWDSAYSVWVDVSGVSWSVCCRRVGLKAKKVGWAQFSCCVGRPSSSCFAGNCAFHAQSQLLRVLRSSKGGTVTRARALRAHEMCSHCKTT